MQTKHIYERFSFRHILPSEVAQAVAIEQICFPPNEACSARAIAERVAAAPELFLVAVDRDSGRLAGFLNGLATDEAQFRDAFFTDASLYQPSGAYVMLLGLDVLPQYRNQGLARALVETYAAREAERKALVLTCLEDKVALYRHLGFVDEGEANSTWGGERWHQMRLPLRENSVD
ncbi:MAG: GNAT family N-acetyltransferase [Eubacteriales bacterium]|nr:GNAT family N-acetyltransferase [Eubacteriales bacterium]